MKSELFLSFFVSFEILCLALEREIFPRTKGPKFLNANNFEHVKKKLYNLKENANELLEMQFDYKERHFDQRTSSCVDPSEEVLAALQVGFMNQFDQFNGMFSIKNVSSRVFQEFTEKKSHVHDYDTKMCNSKKNLTKLNELAICPYHVKVFDRIDRYPHLRTQAICECKHCTRVPLKDDAFYKCMPVKILMPALKRNNNSCAKGVYKWTPILEYISVACECRREFFGVIDIE